MLLAHIADIHFRTPHCLNPAIDPDRPFRTRMIQDIRDRSAGLGSVDALLVGGDIAFKGDREEYVTARAWLEEFASACGCPMERVFVVPGNHDVDRAVIATSTAVRNAQAAIMRSDDRQREQELRTQFSDTDSGRALVAPLGAYNEFAKFFDCQIFPPERLYWKQILPLEMGVQLHIHGLTSTFLSGSNGEDDTRGTLYLSPLQTVLDPLDDVINVVLCHHPPSWLLDHDEVDDAIRDRAAIQLFGHEHRARIDKGDGFIRCSAGAVNPDRYETGWKPGYNLINVQVSDENQDRTLEVKVHVLEWQSNPELYRPVLSQGDEPVFCHRISIRRNISLPALEDPDTKLATLSPRTFTTDENRSETAEVPMDHHDTRNLVFRFWSLSVSQRREIALKLGLINSDELRLAEPERYGRALLRASRQGLLAEVAREVSLWEKQ